MLVGWDSSSDGAGKHSNDEEKISCPDRTQMFGLHTCDLPYVRKPLNEDEEKTSCRDQTEMFGLHTDDDLAYSPPNNVSAANTVPQELMAVGTTEGCLRVWMRFDGSHGWIPAWTQISTDGSIVCLSFRADGQLLAAGASQLLNSNELDTTIRNHNPNELLEHVHLYETSNWSCVASLGFKSRIGSCIFYHPSTSRSVARSSSSVARPIPQLRHRNSAPSARRLRRHGEAAACDSGGFLRGGAITVARRKGG
jgi:hypothetical protein